MALSDQQLQFIEEYLTSWNATKAAKKAGYSSKTARQQGSRLLSNVDIRTAIDERLAEAAMSSNEVLARISLIARADMGEFIGKTPKQLAAHPASWLIKEYEAIEDEYGTRIKIKLHDAQAALTHLWKHHQLAQGKATDAVDLTDAKERLAQRLARLAPQGAADQPAGDADGG